MNKIFTSKKQINMIKDLNLNSRPAELKPEKFYEITEFFESL